MKHDVLMPKLGESITEGTIVKWWKKPGDYVKKDETLLEISTDKVDSEIPSPHEGVIVELKYEENDTVEVDGVIAVIDSQTPKDDLQSADEPAQAAPEPPEESRLSAEEDQSPSPAVPSGDGNTITVEMPKLGESITEGTIVKWWKKPGEYVKQDETLLEISTDKVDSEIPSPYEGQVVEILAEENATVEVGSAIARIQTAVGAPAAVSPETQQSQHAPQPKESTAPSPGVPSETGEPQTLPRKKGRRFYSPLVRSIARKEKISINELETIPGTGVDGRVTKRDILNYINSGRVTPPVTPAEPPAQPAAPTPRAVPPAAAIPSTEEVSEKWRGQRVEVIPMDVIRRKIADHMVISKATSPHVYGVAECDFSSVMAMVTKHRESFQQREQFKLTVNPFILFAITRAISDYPQINSSVEGHNIIQKHYLNIGMAVATDRGLIVPTLKRADELNFLGIARNAYDLAIRARDKKLSPEDVQGATFTVTNYGVFGNIIGFPIINQPNVAILGVGAIKKRPVVIETAQGDVIGIRSIGFLTLSYDHRIVDGELGDKFLQRVVYYLENFEEDWL